MHDEMRRIVGDLDGRRLALFEEAQTKLEAFDEIAAERAHAGSVPEDEPDSFLNGDERRELARWRNLARYRPAVTDYLKAQVFTAGKRYPEALAAIERVAEAGPMRPDLLLQQAELYLRLGRWRDARQAYERVLAIDPDNAHAHLGMCRVALRRRKFAVAAQSALDALERIHHEPLAHFLLGISLAAMKDYERAAGAFRAAISLNPNFPEAHARLAALLEKYLGAPESAREHRRLARSMRNRGNTDPVCPPVAERAEFPAALSMLREIPFTAAAAGIAPLEESLIVVTGLPRSGTSMLMQMLAVGGMRILSDELRQPDEDNPRGYLEFEPVKNLQKDSTWLFEERGKVVKIVAPLLNAIGFGLPRDLLQA
jgi:tetratricopeptide (TPR) repeat protein